MALFSFGKKDKNPPQAPVVVAKAAPKPPAIQTPPVATVTAPVKPPQLSGLMPSPGVPAGTVTTQPMVMPRAVGAPTRLAPKPAPAAPPTPPAQRSTQRIVLAPAAGSRGTITRTIPAVTGRINLPIGMILRCLPAETLAADMKELESSGAAATEIGLPMNTVLNQLPSGKVEMTLQELVAHIPAGYLRPAEALAPYLSTLVTLPLMDVVMRIPPDLLALRPDQKDVDSSVVNMADPFTDEVLRDQAEAQRQAAAAQPNIIDENQVPATEEFVPRDKVPTPTKSFIPPPRPLAGSSIAKTAGLPQFPSAPGLAAVPSRRTSSIPPLPGLVRNSSPVPPPAPNTSSRRISPSGRLPAPIRAGSPLPMRPQGAPTTPVALPSQSQSPFPEARTTPPMAPPYPGSSGAQTAPLPTPPRIGGAGPAPQTPQPPLRPSVMLPKIAPVPATAVPGSLPESTPAAPAPPTPPAASQIPRIPPPPLVPPAPAMIPPAPVAFTPPAAVPPIPAPPVRPPAPVEPVVAAPVPEAVSAPVAPAPEPSIAPAVATEEAPAETTAPAFPKPGEPDAAADELKRLAALAMQQMEAEKPAVETPTASSADLISATTDEAAQVAKTDSASAPPSAPPLKENAPEAAAVAPITPPAPAAPEPVAAPTPPKPPAAQDKPKEQAAPAAAEPAVALNLNSCTPDDLLKIPGCSQLLAESIVRYRAKIGSFKKIEDLLEVPGMNSSAYRNLTGEEPPQARIPQSLSELLGFPEEQKITLKDVTDRICCWPDVTGCVLGQSSGLSLVGTVPKNLDKAAIVAFAPRMFESINKSFGEITGKETNELIIPTTGTSFNILRNGDLYLIILSRLPQMPDRHVKIARLVLAGLNMLPI